MSTPSARDNRFDRRNFLRRSFLGTLMLGEPWCGWLKAQELSIEEGTPSPEPIPEPHFPDRLHLFIWRNWELVNADRMAQVLQTTSGKILEIGASMGLPQKPQITEDQLRRMYITIIRQNWHILPGDQLIEILGWDRKLYEYTLKEDDFLWVKLGALKPRCKRLKYETPSPEARRRATAIKQTVRTALGSLMHEQGEPPFQFVEELSATRVRPLGDGKTEPSSQEVDLRRGWKLIKTGENSGVSATLLEEFRTYLQSAFGADVGVLPAGGKASKTVQFSLNPSTSKVPGSFEVSVEPDEIRVIGRDDQGLRQAFYYLQDQMEQRGAPFVRQGKTQRQTLLDPRYAYSYFALYGDPLMDEGIDPFPRGFLDRLARAGVDGVWFQAVLRNLAPAKAFPEFGQGCETRLRNLARFVERARDYGMKIYLYLNEPRAMPAEFFVHHPEIRGAHDQGDLNFSAMCTSTAEVREWLSDSLAHVFSRVPGLGGIFCITASENLTNCFSHGQPQFCPRCSKRRGSDVIAELIQTFRDGVRRSSRDAKVIAWDWGWGNNWVKNSAEPSEVISKLPEDVAILSVSEWAKPIDRGGFRTEVGEYSISVVGPGPRAVQNWRLAQRSGLATLAKVQFSNTWEISAVPYIPVPYLVAEHCENLLKAGVRGLMVSWTEGGYPSPNFEVAKAFCFSPSPGAEQALREVAERRYGREAAPAILKAWKAFSLAFVEFPMEGGDVVYRVPTQHGPANLLRLAPTGYKAGMMLFPYDDYRSWVGRYPVETFEKQFEKMARLWETGLRVFRAALEQVPAHRRDLASKDLGIAETCYLHFRSVANQIRFYRLRDAWKTAKGKARQLLAAQMMKIAELESEMAKRQYGIARRDSTIAYEASNHYYYRPLDLAEKVLNSQYVIQALQSDLKAEARRSGNTKFEPGDVGAEEVSGTQSGKRDSRRVGQL